MYDALVRSTLFGVRNADKVINTNDKGRVFADIGQFANAAKAASRLDNAVGRGAQAAIKAMGNVSKESKVLSTAVKGTKWAAKNVNPLLIGAAGYRVVTAKDKETALKKEIFGMTAMFSAESLMKRAFNSSKALNYKSNINNKYLKTGLLILEGLVFVAGSISASAFGYKVGKCFFEKEPGRETVTTLKELYIPQAEKAEKSEKIDNYEKEFFLPGKEKELTA